jgi:hypothetical protein
MSLRGGAPPDVVAVYLPEYMVGRWWENLLNNQSALRPKACLLFQPQVMVISVPWQLRSSRAREAPTRRRPPTGDTVPSQPAPPAEPAQGGIVAAEPAGQDNLNFPVCGAMSG